MTVESASDRLTMLADFGQPVIFSPGDSYPNRNTKTATITGIFDNAFYAVEGDLTGATSKQPTLIVRTADVIDIARNSMVEIGNDKYKVTEPEDDGTGITVINLEGPR